jgi:surface-anchored protein/MYXO-CTERM domain-containing protein
MNSRVFSVALVAALLSLPLVAQAQVNLFNEHVDVGAGYDPALGWDLHVHDETNLAEYEPGDAILHAVPGAATSRPAGSAWDFVGVGAGQTFYRLPEVQNPALLFLGFGAEEIAPADIASWNTGDARLSSPTGQWIRWRLTGVTGAGGGAAPGFVSVWSNDVGGPISFISSFASGLDATDTAYALAGGHQDYNWGFSAPGAYELTFEVNSQFSAGGSSNANNTATYSFVVAAPEPGSAALALLALPLIGLVRYRRRTL